MRVFVAGATGVVGKRAVKQLVAAGNEVKALARTDEKAAMIEGLGGRPVQVDLFDRPALTKAVEGSDAVVNLATGIPGVTRMMSRAAWRNNDRIRTEGSRNLVEAALAGGASRYVQESVTFLYADGGSEWLDEGSPTQPNPVTASALDAEAAAGEFTASGGAGVVLRFGAFYGSDSEHTLLQLKMARAGFSALPGKPQDYVSSISTDDAAAAVLAALEVPAGIYNVVDDQPLTHEEYDRSLAEALGVRRLRRLWLPTGSLEHIARSHRVSNGRLRRVSAWEPRYPSVADAWSDLVAATAHRTPGGGIGSALGV